MKGPPEGPDRLVVLDAVRGAAIVWMLLFHLAYDLNHFGLLNPPQLFLSDPVWTWQRMCIVSLFMFCAGASQALAAQAGSSWTRFWRRWWQLAGCATVVSVATWWVFPQSWISFGVLHGLACMVLLARLTASWPRWLLLALAVLALAAPQLVQHSVFDSRWLNGVGLVTRKPITEDYAPLLPWMGVVWLGLAFGAGLSRVAVGQAVGVKVLARIGQWPLSIYMLHQPIFWGVLLILA